MTERMHFQKIHHRLYHLFLLEIIKCVYMYYFLSTTQSETTSLIIVEFLDKIDGWRYTWLYLQYVCIRMCCCGVGFFFLGGGIIMK